MFAENPLVGILNPASDSTGTNRRGFGDSMVFCSKLPIDWLQIYLKHASVALYPTIQLAPLDLHFELLFSARSSVCLEWELRPFGVACLGWASQSTKASVQTGILATL